MEKVAKALFIFRTVTDMDNRIRIDFIASNGMKVYAAGLSLIDGF